jgi:hypothetical protein
LPQIKQFARLSQSKAYCSCPLRLRQIRNVILLCSETAGSVHRLRAAAMLHRRATLSAPTTRGLLSTASSWIRLPAAPTYLPISATLSTTSSRPATPASPSLLLPTPSRQSTVEQHFQQNRPFLGVMPFSERRIPTPNLLMSISRERFRQMPMRLQSRKIYAGPH